MQHMEESPVAIVMLSSPVQQGVQDVQGFKGNPP